MYYDEAKEAEDEFVDQQKKDCRERGFELTFETECTMRWAFSRGWDAISSLAYHRGREAAKATARAAIGAAPDSWDELK